MHYTDIIYINQPLMVLPRVIATLPWPCRAKGHFWSADVLITEFRHAVLIKCASFAVEIPTLLRRSATVPTVCAIAIPPLLTWSKELRFANTLATKSTWANPLPKITVALIGARFLGDPRATTVAEAREAVPTVDSHIARLLGIGQSQAGAKQSKLE